MKIAKIINGEILIQSIYETFPNVSFPESGVPDSFLQENNLYKVVESIAFNPETQTLRLLYIPVLRDNIVFTVDVISKTNEEIKSEKMLKIRQQRNIHLSESDIYVTIDRWETYSEDKKTAWRQYRQALRDLPQLVVDLDLVSWPVSPNNQQVGQQIN